jgi:hypothetical protein
VIRLKICSNLTALVIACSVLAPAASGQKVNIHSDPEADFSRIRQYQWRIHPVYEKKPELQEVYATGNQLVMEAANQELMKRGFQPVESSPDVYLTFYLHARPGQTERTVMVDPWWGAGYGWYTSPAWITTEIDRFVDGMVVIDIIDARSSKLIWRAYCGDQIRDFRERDKNITKAVRKALERFPPKKK